MEKNLKPCPRFYVLVLFLLLLHSGSTKGQQAYLNNDQLECDDESKDNNVTRGFLCNGVKKSCKSYITFRAEPPYTSAVTIAYLLGAQPNLISFLKLNNLSSNVSSIPTNSLVFVPLICSWTHHLPGIMDLKVGNKLQVPLRCACPTLDQTKAGFKFLLTYIADWGDSISSIAETFGVDEQRVLHANKLIEDMIYPFSPILVPISTEPTMILSPQATPSPPPPSQINIALIKKSKSSSKWVFVGIGIAAAPPPELQPLVDSIDYFDKSWFVSIQGGRYVVESLTPYKFKDLEAATGNFSEFNIIKGFIYQGLFQGDDAVVKVMKGDVSAEMNLLKKINNNNNIVRLSSFCVHGGNSYLVYEHVEKGSLDDLLQSSKCQTSFTLSWKQRIHIAYNVADALNYLHNYINPPYIHKNLKTSNILLDGNFRAKVANFELVRIVENDGGLQLTRHVVGT
ncbi:hypothetical protein CRYUN_Cryun05aG0050200 [Craigia yunnanensis]